MLPYEISIPLPFFAFHRGKGRMLDHLLISRNLLEYFKRSEVHDELPHDETIAFATDTGFPESDHAPVAVELELP